jgi:hypothetical protein
MDYHDWLEKSLSHPLGLDHLPLTSRNSYLISEQNQILVTHKRGESCCSLNLLCLPQGMHDPHASYRSWQRDLTSTHMILTTSSSRIEKNTTQSLHGTPSPETSYIINDIGHTQLHLPQIKQNQE